MYLCVEMAAVGCEINLLIKSVVWSPWLSGLRRWALCCVGQKVWGSIPRLDGQCGYEVQYMGIHFPDHTLTRYLVCRFEP